MKIQVKSNGRCTSCFGILIAIVFSLGRLGAEPTNIILFIGDGMGPEQVKAAGMFVYGSPGTLFFESLPYRGELTTYSASSSVTDSAAAATALASGIKVNNGVISMAYPGDGSELFTLLERYKAQGRSTGLVTTTYMTHATPAAFGAHEPSRANTSEIAADYLNQTRPDVLLGGGANGLSVSAALGAGYTVVENRTELLSLDTESATMVSGQFGSGHLPYEFDGLGDLPHLADMTVVALDILDNDPDGFFLVVEGGRIDHACHSNDIHRALPEVVEFDRAVQKAMDWAQARNDTLVLVTADHETGGLTLLANNGAGAYPTVSWSTGGHTSTNVPVYAWGVNAEGIGGIMDNTDIFDVVTHTAAAPQPATSPSPPDGAADIPTGAVLKWSPGKDAALHAVYFGTDNPPPLVGSQSEASYDPGPLASETTYFWRVDEVGAGGTTPGAVWSFATVAPIDPVAEAVASGEFPIEGTATNDLNATTSQDGVYEEITEVLSSSQKPDNARSFLEHRWLFEVRAGAVVTFYLKAHHTANGEGDDFIFAYSTDNITYMDMLTVTRTIDEGPYQTFGLPSNLSGPVYVRVTDTDLTKGNSTLDTLYVDHMYIRSSVTISAPGMATEPSPPEEAVDVLPDPELNWTAGEDTEWHDVYLGTAPDSLALVSRGQRTNAYRPGPLLPNHVYYWRVDEGNSYGSTPGAVWSLSTADTSCAPATMRVDVVLETLRGRRGARFGKVTVIVQDDCGQPVPGAQIAGHFTGDFAGEAPQAGVTDTSGLATFVTSTAIKRPSFSFVVDEVSHEGLVWLP